MAQWTYPIGTKAFNYRSQIFPANISKCRISSSNVGRKQLWALTGNIFHSKLLSPTEWDVKSLDESIWKGSIAGLLLIHLAYWKISETLFRYNYTKHKFVIGFGMLPMSCSVHVCAHFPATHSQLLGFHFISSTPWATRGSLVRWVMLRCLCVCCHYC